MLRGISRNFQRFVVCLVLAGGTAAPFGLFAQTLELDDAVERALKRDPDSRALQERARGLREQAVADGALPDPELFVGAEGIPINNPASSDMMTMYKLGVRQRFPAGDSRRLSRERTGFLAAAGDMEMQARQRQVALQVRQAWLDWKLARQILDLARNTEQAFAELVELTESRYRGGRGRQMDISQARLEHARLQQTILAREAEAAEARARLIRWTGPLGNESVEPGDAPPWAEPDDHFRLLERLGQHPALRADEQRTEAGQAGTSLARQAYRPEWMLEAGYGHQRGSAPMGGRMSDKLFAMVSFNLPLFTGDRQDRRVASAQAELVALDHDRSGRLHAYEGRLDQALSNWDRFGRMLTLYQEHLLPEADRLVESTRSAYQADRAGFDELIRARMDQLDQEVGRLEAWRSRQSARVELLYLTGGDS